MAHDTSRSRRDAALHAVLVERAKADRSRQHTTASSSEETGRRLPVLVTALVLAAIVALSAGAIAAGQFRLSAASQPLMPVSTHPAESAAAAPSSNPTPSSTPSVPLIAMDGAATLTRTQLHTWTLTNRGESPNAVIGEQQDWIKIQCMAEHGYLYDPTFEGDQGLELGKTWGLTTKQLQGYRDALWGSNLTSPKKPYDWHDAGCDGRAVHLTGQDNDH